MPLPTIQELRELSNDKDSRKSVLESLRVAKAHCQDIRLHTEATVSEMTGNPAYLRFLDRVDGYLVKDKFKVFKKYHRFPMASTATCSSIIQQLNKVFDGTNANRSANYSNEKVEQDYMAYLNKTGFVDRWRTDSLKAMASDHNAIIIADMPKEAAEPYFYFLSINDVYDMDMDETGRVIWVQYFQREKELIHVSQEGWQTVKTSANGGGDLLSIEYEAANTTGMDIAWFFWEETVTANDKLVKKSPFSEWVSKLDWFEVWACWKRMLDADGIAPVTWSIQEDCDFRDDQAGLFCDGGYMKNSETGFYARGASSSIDNGYRTCPKCSDKRFTAPGSHLEIPAPDKETDMRDPFGRITIDIDSLKNAREEEIRLKEEIIKGITGGGQEPINQKAINVTQVSALFEGWRGVLRQIKKSFESSEKKVLEVMAALRYGRPVLEIDVNYGSDWYLLTEQESLAFYTVARDAGLPDYILDFLLGEYYKTKFRFDKKGFERVKLLMNIEPFKHIPKAKIVEMSKAVGIDNKELYLKLNFGSMTQRFELENGSVVEFGVNIDSPNPFAARVTKIKEIMLSYIPEIPVLKQPEPTA